MAVILLSAGGAWALGPCSTDWSDFPTDGDLKADCPTCATWYELNAVHGRSRPELSLSNTVTAWAVGKGGVILRYNGSNWAPYTPSPTTQDLNDVYIFPDGTGWAIGARGTILRLNAGGVWSCYNCPDVNCTSGAAFLNPVETCVTLYDIFPEVPYGNCTTLFVAATGACPPGTYITRPVILVGNTTSWQKLTDDDLSCPPQYTAIPPPCSTYGLQNTIANGAFNCSLRSYYAGIKGMGGKGILFDSQVSYLMLYYNSGSNWWFRNTSVASLCGGPAYPAFYTAALGGYFNFGGGDTDSCNSFLASPTNLFYQNTVNSFTGVDTGMVAADYGTIRHMEFLPLWGFGIGVGWGNATLPGADYNTARDDAYFVHFKYPDPTRLPAPADPASLNKVTYYQRPAAKTWPRLHGCYIMNYNEAWAVGNDSTILHWTGPTVADADLDISFSTTRIGMELTIVMSVTNIGGTALKDLYPYGLDVSPANGAVLTSGPSPAGPLGLPPGGPLHFTWTYSLTGYGTGNIRFTGTASGIDAIKLSPVTESNYMFVPMPLVSSFTSEVSKSCDNVYFHVITLTVTNNGSENVYDLVPYAGVTLSPGPSSILAGPTPSTFAGPLGPGVATTFQWTYSTSGAPPTTYNGGIWDAIWENPLRDEHLWTRATGNAGALTAGKLDSNLSIMASMMGPNSYYFSLTLSLTNNGANTLTGVSVYPAGYPTPNPLGPAFTPAVPSLPVDIGPGANQTINWTATLFGSLPVNFTTIAGGTDSGTLLPTCVTNTTAVTAAPGVLSTSMTARTYKIGPDRYKVFVDMTVTNTGAFSATNFVPSASLAISPGASASVYGPLPDALDLLAPGASQTFSYCYLVNGPLPATFIGALSATIMDNPTGTPTFVTASTTTGPLETSGMAAAVSIKAEQERTNLDYRWRLTVVLTVTPTHDCVTCPATNFVPEDLLDVTKAGDAWKLDGPTPATYAGSVMSGQGTSFTWTYSATGTVNLTFGAGAWATILGSATHFIDPNIPAYAYASNSISLKDDGDPGGFTVDLNMLKSRSDKLRIFFNLKEDGPATLKIYNSIGQMVALLYDQYTPRRVDILKEWDGRSCSSPQICDGHDGARVSSGIYFIRLESKRYVKTRKVVVTKM